MIVVDTNVISEITRPRPDERVIGWFARQTHVDLHLASPVMAELLSGLFLLPGGARRRSLEIATAAILETYFGNRLLAFDHDAAWYFASITTEARRSGQNMAPMDAQIAAIASAWGASVASRDTAPFMAAGITTINPWTA